ncbi:MAG TPA: hypothetical protein VIZ68_06640, partial [Thermoplasmata archaeon]
MFDRLFATTTWFAGPISATADGHAPTGTVEGTILRELPFTTVTRSEQASGTNSLPVERSTA